MALRCCLRCCFKCSWAEPDQDTCRVLTKRFLSQCTLILCARCCVKGFGLAHAHTPRKVLLKRTDHVPHPSNDQKVLQTIRFRNVSMMVLDGLRFLEFIGPLKSAIHPSTPKGPIGPRGAKFAHPSPGTLSRTQRGPWPSNSQWPFCPKVTREARPTIL